MIREIKKKRVILENRRPYASEATEYIQEMDYVDWIYTSMRLDGSALSRNNIEKLLQGEVFENATLFEHGEVNRYQDVIREAKRLLEWQTSLSVPVIFQLYRILTGNSNPEYRRTNPVLFTINYNPPHPQEVEEQMDILLHWLREADCDSNPLLKAAYLHNKFIEIYPFEVHCEAMARCAMYYYVMEQGFPPFPLNLSESEYNGVIALYLKKEDISPMHQAIERGMFNKLEVMMQLTALE